MQTRLAGPPLLLRGVVVPQWSCSVSVAQASFSSSPDPPTPQLTSSTLKSLVDKLGSPTENPPPSPSPSQGDATSSRHRIIFFSSSNLHRKETTEAPHNHSTSHPRPVQTPRRGRSSSPHLSLLTPPCLPINIPQFPPPRQTYPNPTTRRHGTRSLLHLRHASLRRPTFPSPPSPPHRRTSREAPSVRPRPRGEREASSARPQPR